MEERVPPAKGESPTKSEGPSYSLGTSSYFPTEETYNSRASGCETPPKSESNSRLSTSLSLPIEEIHKVTPQSESPTRTGTTDAIDYLVQVSKDSVYNVPSQENSSLLQSYLKSRRHDDPYCSFTNVIGAFLTLLLLGLVMVILIFYYFLLPNKPTFFIDRFIVYYMNDTRGNYFPQYDFTLEAKKRSAAVGVIYDVGEHAFLSFQQQKIATKNPPLLDQDVKESTKLRIVLPGSDSVVPLDLLKRLKIRATIPLSLSIDLHVKMKFGVLKSWGTDMNIFCTFKVNSFAKDTRILSQKCHVTV
ncbi:hypothetical protein C5167_028158 [Papaver somniferum]|uniref:NDR1/HIN1-like protein 13 n=1 Tax=Papaver somniferum TaxID=3469 RepID=UPI000E700308|nr:NDR1/HIN1-like protein 13 [Papaver somniferum]RZC87707.1 hypothetical protein C5167_028158 [Papaver somniferum]